MKKSLAACSLALALTMALSVSASAAAIITGESFGKTSKNNWVDDHYAPEEFDFSDNQLYLALGKTGYTKNRPAEQKDKYYAHQGKKLQVEMTSSTTWTATVKLNVDDTWFSNNGNRKRAEFRVDLVDSAGQPVTPSPAIAVIKAGSTGPTFKYVNPKAKIGGWGTADSFINGDKEKESFYIEEGWHTLLIKSTKGVITYYVDEKKVGNCSIDNTDVYPSFMALGAYNYERPDVTNWDNCYLYDGSYTVPQRSTSMSEKREESLSSRYESKRERWIKQYTVYQKPGTDRWFTASNYEKEYGSKPTDAATSLSKEIPDSYWDY